MKLLGGCLVFVGLLFITHGYEWQGAVVLLLAVVLIDLSILRPCGR